MLLFEVPKSNEKYVEDIIMDQIIEETVAKQTAYILGE